MFSETYTQSAILYFAAKFLAACNNRNVDCVQPPLISVCYYPPVIEGQILRVSERYEDLEYRYNLLVGVSAVHYDEIDHIKVGDVITIKTCSLPSRIRFKRTYHLSGSRECETNELEISQNGVIADIPTLGAGPCPPYILAGNCDDPR